MIEFKCPAEYRQKSGVTYSARLFVGGGISGCPNWQPEFINSLEELKGVLFNPRREDFNINDLSLSNEQIEWEHRHLKRSTIASFWFPCESVCPISLFELGVCSKRIYTELFVGCHPDYSRKFDVKKQLSLARPEVIVVDNLEDLAKQVKVYLNDFSSIAQVGCQIINERLK